MPEHDDSDLARNRAFGEIPDDVKAEIERVQDGSCKMIMRKRAAGLPVSEAVTIKELADRAGLRYGVNGGFPPSVMLCGGGGHRDEERDESTGQRVFILDTNVLSGQTEQEKALCALAVLAFGFGSYEAAETLKWYGIVEETHTGRYFPKLGAGRHA
jgi:hypothetical protein